jgi:diguanylate cyclase (GGDEF)-like protein
MNLDALTCDCPDCPAVQVARHLLEENARLRNLAGQDELTGLPNRRGMRATWSTWCHAGGDMVRRSAALVALVDLDLFKPINDIYGHEAGDRILCRLAGLLVATGGIAARLGGDEFVVFLPDGPADVLQVFAAAVSEPVEVLPAVKVSVTVSIGAVAVGEVERHRDPDVWLGRLLRAADMRLYMAKDAGRARVVGPGR